MQTKNFSVVRAGAVALVVATFAAAVGIGCSGSSRSHTADRSQPTKMRVQVAWPARSRVVPKAAQLLQVRVFAGEPEYDVEVGQTDIVRPAGNAPVSEQTIDNLPAQVKVRVVVKAYPNADGSGTPQALSSQDLVSGASGATTETDLTMNSTTARVEVSSGSFSLSTGESTTVTAVSYDDKNNVVLTDPSGWTWTSTGAATVDPVGNPVTIRAGQEGAATITGTDSDSGKTVTVSVIVHKDTGAEGCHFEGQLYGDRCPNDANGNARLWNCKTGACEVPLVY